ncbi:MAG TPA: pyridoxal phosphate-dependent aminotransferase [Thermomicrobiaceae bacterium]|nr:pyridoxal phosphate-dependent aminotransferase [Thermomicrobiaceae bacterium]
MARLQEAEPPRRFPVEAPGTLHRAIRGTSGDAIGTVVYSGGILRRLKMMHNRSAPPAGAADRDQRLGVVVDYRFAARVGAIQPSPTVAVSDRVRELRQQGHDVMDLGGGDPDFPTPEHICRAAADAMARGDTHYVASPGIIELRAAIARKLKSDNGIDVEPSQIVVTPGGKSALFSAVLSLVGPGDDVAMFDPGWVSYEPMATIAGAGTVRIPLDPANDYEVTREEIVLNLTPATRVLVVNTPNNPTGRVLSIGELEVIRDVAIERDLIVISDEIYEKIVYDGYRHISPASLPGMAERTLTCNGFSKAYAMTGWRLGYIAGPRPIIQQLLKIHSHSVTCANSFAQYGATAALDGPQGFIDYMVEAWDRRRHLMASGLSAIRGVHCPLPEGAFYALAHVGGTGMTGQQVAKVLIDEARVGVTPGDAFGAVTADHIRLSFANSDQMIEQSLERIQRALEG